MVHISPMILLLITRLVALFLIAGVLYDGIHASTSTLNINTHTVITFQSIKLFVLLDRWVGELVARFLKVVWSHEVFDGG